MQHAPHPHAHPEPTDSEIAQPLPMGAVKTRAIVTYTENGDAAATVHILGDYEHQPQALQAIRKDGRKNRVYYVQSARQVVL